MKRVFSYLSPFRVRMTVGFFIKVMATLAELLLPVILTHILKLVGEIGDDFTPILLWGSLMLLFAILACALNITANRMAATVGQRFSEKLQRDLFYRTLTLDTRQTDDFTIPSLESRITRQLEGKAEVTVFNIGEKDVRPCLACDGCKRQNTPN